MIDAIAAAQDLVLQVHNLRVGFADGPRTIEVLDGISFGVPRTRTVALVGESGCGKSVTVLSILRLLPSPPARYIDGKIIFTDQATSRSLDLFTASDREMRRIRGGKIAMIFQDPMSALHPAHRIGDQIADVIRLHADVSARDARRRAGELLAQVGIDTPRRRARQYPHELSGGMRQRVMIAMALSCEPALLIADEPTTALDATVQRQVLDLLHDLQRARGLSVLLITHDLSAVTEFANHVHVMYAGRIVEHGETRSVLNDPRHPYTQGLLACAPRMTHARGQLPVIPGTVPAPDHYPSGCRFHPRCPKTIEAARAAGRFVIRDRNDHPQLRLRRCVENFPEEPSGPPQLREVAPSHHVACWEAERQIVD